MTTATTDRDIDPITLSTVWHGFQSVGREMRHVIDRTAQNYLIAQLHDMAAGIWDVQGRTIAVPEGPTSMFLSQGFTVQYILDKFGVDEPPPGRRHPRATTRTRATATTCPTGASSGPIFYEDELLFIALTRGHQMDTGGAFPGGYFPNGYDIHAEGIMIPPIKIVRRGRRAHRRPRADLEQRPLARGREDRQLRPDGRAQGRREPDRRDARQVRPRHGHGLRRGDARPDGDERPRPARRPSRTAPSRASPRRTTTARSSTRRSRVRCDATIKGDELILDFSPQRRAAQGLRQLHLLVDLSAAPWPAASCTSTRPSPSSTTRARCGRSRSSLPRAPSSTRTYPATVGGSPVNVGTQVLEATVNALSKAMPDKAIAGWGRRRGHYIAGVDPRTGRALRPDDDRCRRRRGRGVGLRRLRGRAGHVRPGLDQPRQRRGDRDPLPVADRQVALPARPVGRRRAGAAARGMAVGGREPGRRRRRGDGHLGRRPDPAAGRRWRQTGPLSHMYIRRGDEVPHAQTHRMVQVAHGEILGKVSRRRRRRRRPAERDPAAVLRRRAQRDRHRRRTRATSTASSSILATIDASTRRRPRRSRGRDRADARRPAG